MESCGNSERGTLARNGSGKVKESCTRSSLSSVRSGALVGGARPVASDGLRRAPSPSIGASNDLRAGDKTLRSTSATRSSKCRSPSVTTSQPSFSMKGSSHPMKSSSLNPKFMSNSHPKTTPKPLQSPPASNCTAQMNCRSSSGEIKQTASFCGGLASPTAKDKPNIFCDTSGESRKFLNEPRAAKDRVHTKLVLEGNVKPKSAAKVDVLRLSAGINTSAGSPTSRRHSLSSPVLQQPPSTPGRRKSDPRSLQQVDSKAGEDVRLDLRGQNLWRLDHNAVNLTPRLEFVYLRDNKLTSMSGLEVLRRVKVLDLSFNDFKGGGFEPLVNCKALQQLYLAGNQIISLSSLPQLPNLEFLSVAQNKLKSLMMPPQPKLQVLAASNNKISTFKGFPHLPVLEVDSFRP